MDVISKAQEKATQALQMPIGQRRKLLEQLAATNPTEHAMVKQKMEEIRQQGASAGRANALQMTQQ
jgi:hypothetical protein